MPYFEYGKKEIEYLKKKDKRLAVAIERIGKVEREVMPDLFEALVNAIVGQQVSMKAQATIWQRMKEGIGEITPGTILGIEPEELKAYGISMRKVSYIRDAAENIVSGRLDLAKLENMEDEEVCKILSGLRGVGVWTAEMLMLFSMQRPDVFSYGDLAIRRGLCMLHHHKEMPKERFERYRKRYSPYGSTVSLYLWAIAGGSPFEE